MFFLQNCVHKLYSCHGIIQQFNLACQLTSHQSISQRQKQMVLQTGMTFFLNYATIEKSKYNERNKQMNVKLQNKF